MFRITPFRRLQKKLHDLNQHLAKRGIHRKNSFYDSLGLTPHATQADIKQAFYKLSMQCHPDRSKGDDIKFREISAAYEVLGNLKLRKMYDKGYLPVGASASTYEKIKEETEPVEDFRDQFGRRPEGQKAPPNGRTDAYNYDEWTRMHYSDTFTRSHNRMSEQQWKQYQRRTRQAQVEQANRLVRLLTILMFCSLFFSFPYTDWDVPSKPRRD